MSDVLKVSTPLSGYENTSKGNPISTTDANIKNVNDVSKVTRLDGQSSNADYSENQLLLPHNSNFDGFIKALKGNPFVTDVMKDLLFVEMENLVKSGINENFAEEISQFLEMIKISEDKLPDFLKTQMQASAKFQGPFFQILRRALSETNSSNLSFRILEFIKKYNDFTSNGHVLNEIFSNLNNITQYMPASFAKNLLNIMENLDSSAPNTDLSSNTEVLKKEIIPFLSQYVKTTNDFGKVRDLITALTLNIARYENGSKEGFLGAFKELLGYNTIKEKLGNGDADKLMGILMQMEGKKSDANPLQDKLISILKKGINGDAGYENIDNFKNILTSTLINESVYMPLLHTMLPLNINGNMMFSELWVDPDDKSGKAAQGDKKKEKFLIKFDIKEVGFFDLIILHDNGNVDLQIFCPDKLMGMVKVIQSGLLGIIEQNGMSVKSLSVKKGKEPITISEVFPKIYERKNAVNVRI
ncbi:MAG TPA: hypothetical protein DIC60_00360 [Lachnospiraceae bacterium]|nr:hypothetical protein [Lachnospiraceae bacterium]